MDNSDSSAPIEHPRHPDVISPRLHELKINKVVTCIENCIQDESNVDVSNVEEKINSLFSQYGNCQGCLYIFMRLGGIEKSRQLFEEQTTDERIKFALIKFISALHKNFVHKYYEIATPSFLMSLIMTVLDEELSDSTRGSCLVLLSDFLNRSESMRFMLGLHRFLGDVVGDYLRSEFGGVDELFAIIKIMSAIREFQSTREEHYSVSTIVLLGQKVKYIENRPDIVLVYLKVAFFTLLFHKRDFFTIFPPDILKWVLQIVCVENKEEKSLDYFIRILDLVKNLNGYFEKIVTIRLENYKPVVENTLKLALKWSQNSMSLYTPLKFVSKIIIHHLNNDTWSSINPDDTIENRLRNLALEEFIIACDNPSDNNFRNVVIDLMPIITVMFCHERSSLRLANSAFFDKCGDVLRYFMEKRNLRTVRSILDRLRWLFDRSPIALEKCSNMLLESIAYVLNRGNIHWLPYTVHICISLMTEILRTKETAVVTERSGAFTISQEIRTSAHNLLGALPTGEHSANFWICALEFLESIALSCLDGKCFLYENREIIWTMEYMMEREFVVEDGVFLHYERLRNSIGIENAPPVELEETEDEGENEQVQEIEDHEE